MKRIVPIIILLALAVFAVYSSSSRDSGQPQQSAPHTALKSPDQKSSVSSPGAAAPANANPGGAAPAVSAEDEEGTVDQVVQPAASVYKSAEEALAAVKKGAADYDDTILEQFTEPGEDCTWCPEFYKNLRDTIAVQGTSPDQLSYFGELLAVSGRVENLQALADGIKNPPSPDAAEAYAEALELTVGKDNVVSFLAQQLDSNNERLQEASVAALTNQGTRLAAEELYKNTVKRGDADGYYARGIGLGEFVPDEEALPYFQELVNKRDQYSHLAVKALMNAGVNGLRMVIDSLENSKDGNFDRQMLKDATEHANYDDEIEQYLRTSGVNSANPAVQEFSKKVLESIQSQLAEEAVEVPTEDVAQDG